MTNLPIVKKTTTYIEQMELLRGRGLVISDHESSKLHKAVKSRVIEG